MDKRMNLTMLTDFYEITMANGYFESGMADDIAYFDMFFRRVPDGGGYAIMAGLEQLIDYLKNLKFTDADIEYLRGKNIFCEDFLEYLRNFEFKCDVWAVPEGTPIFPHEPIVTVRGPVMQAQFIETMVLLCINHQSMIATKASRIVRAAKGRPVMEFGSRRAHGADAAIIGRARGLYRWLCRYSLRDRGQRLRHRGIGNDGAQLGADVSGRVFRFQEVRGNLSGQLRAAGGYLQCAEIRRSCGDQGIQGNEACQDGYPYRLRRRIIFDETGA